MFRETVATVIVSESALFEWLDQYLKLSTYLSMYLLYSVIITLSINVSYNIMRLEYTGLWLRTN